MHGRQSLVAANTRQLDACSVSSVNLQYFVREEIVYFRDGERGD